MLVVALPLLSPQAAASHLPAPAPLVAPLPLVVSSSPLVPLVHLARLVVVLPIFTLPPPICRGHRLLSRHCLSLRPSWASCPASCCITSFHATAYQCAITYPRAPLGSLHHCLSLSPSWESGNLVRLVVATVGKKKRGQVSC